MFRPKTVTAVFTMPSTMRCLTLDWAKHFTVLNIFNWLNMPYVHLL